MRLRFGIVLLGLAGVWGAIGACEARAGDESVATAGDSIRVVDRANRAVQLAAPAQRVISLMPSVTDMLLAMGAQDRLIARTRFDTAARIAHLPATGNALEPSVEWIAALEPELVIAWPDQPSRSTVGRLAAIGIPVYGAITESTGDVLRIAHDLGTLLGMQAAADSLVRSIEMELQAVRGAVQPFPRVRVVYVLSVDPPVIAGPTTFIGELIDVAGGANVFADVSTHWPQVNLEGLLQRDPDAIVLAQEHGFTAVDQLRGRAGWRELRAVRAGRVLAVDVDLFNRAGPNLPHAARTLARFLHPEAGW